MFIRLMIPVTWRGGARQRVRLMQEFAQTELDSAWQSLHALDHVDEPRIRSLLLNHALEELHHAELFADAAKEQTDYPVAIPLTRRTPLSDIQAGGAKEAARFFAALSVGESEIRNDFQIYRRSIPDPKIKELFKRIAEDEDGHAEESTKSLEIITRENGISMRKIWREHLWNLFLRRYKSLGMKMGSFVLETLLSVLYFVFGVIAYLQARKRIAMPYDQQLAIGRSQKDLSEARMREA